MQYFSFYFARVSYSQLFSFHLKYHKGMVSSFKENLRDFLDYKDITIKELSFLSGVPRRSIENYLNARSSMPPADYACKIAKALGTTVEYLVNHEKTEESSKLPAFSEDALKIAKTYQNLPKKDQIVIQRITEALGKVSK